MNNTHTIGLILLIIVTSCRPKPANNETENQSITKKVEQAEDTVTLKRSPKNDVKPQVDTLDQEIEVRHLNSEQQIVVEKFQNANQENPIYFSDTVYLRKEHWWRFCDKYWKNFRSISSLYGEYFNAFYLQPTLQNNNIDKTNKDFLKVLFNELVSKSKNQIKSSYEPQKALFSIIYLPNKPAGIYVGQRVTKNENGSYEVLNLEKSLVKPFQNDEEWKDQLNSGMPFRFNDGVLDTIPFFEETQFFGYSGNSRTPIEIVRFGSTISECDTEYFYELKGVEGLAEEQVKIGSYHDFILEPYENEEIDALVNHNLCSDCPSSTSSKVFAKFKGIDGLYFSYAKDGHTPGAKLHMKMEDKYVTIWSNRSDQFGCACL